MIKVQRTPAPAILARKSASWLDQYLAAKTGQKRTTAENRYRHPQVKKALIELFHGKCAYCESKITHVDYGHIEHFRPKSGPAGHPELTFEWSNLFLACGICNGGEHKSDRFPSAAERGPIVNPCDDDPRDHFVFRYDRISRLASVYGKTPRGITTELLLGLNRPELRAHRSLFVHRLAALCRLAHDDPEAQELLRDAVKDDAEYSAFVRALIDS